MKLNARNSYETINKKIIEFYGKDCWIDTAYKEVSLYSKAHHAYVFEFKYIDKKDLADTVNRLEETLYADCDEACCSSF